MLNQPDLLVTAAGQPDLVKKENIKDGAWLIDAGTTMIERDGIKCFVGDATLSPEEYEQLEGYTPTPGGIGPLTVIWLFKNLTKAYKIRVSNLRNWILEKGSFFYIIKALFFRHN